MIDRTHALPLTQQVVALGISRGAVYYEPRPTSALDLALMRRIDALHLDYPWMGARFLKKKLQPEFPGVGRRRIGTLMRTMGIVAMVPQPGTSRRHRAHPVYPYLLRHRTITRPNSDFCVDAVTEAITRYGRPAIFNTDQGSQFTSAAFTGLLTDHGIQISMDGRGCWRDNIFVERLWRSLKYEEVYLHAYDSVSAARAGLSKYFHIYNAERPHSSLADRTPDDAYFHPLPRLAVAA